MENTNEERHGDPDTLETEVVGKTITKLRGRNCFRYFYKTRVGRKSTAADCGNSTRFFARVKTLIDQVEEEAIYPMLRQVLS